MTIKFTHDGAYRSGQFSIFKATDRVFWPTSLRRIKKSSAKERIDRIREIYGV